MKRHAPYTDSKVNPHAASQMQHNAAQRMQQNTAMNNFPGQPDSFSAEQGRPHSSQAEGQWQWDGDARKEPNLMSSHIYTEGQGGSAARAFYQVQMPDPNIDLDKQPNKELRLQSHEQDMEIGYEDRPSQLTFEGLEQKFQDEILKLVKEQSDAEDAENARHKEKIIEINTQYHEKLSSLRVQQAKRREEFLHKETQARLNQYEQAGIGHQLINTAPNDPHIWGGAVAAEVQRVYAIGQFESHREQPPFRGGRNQGVEARVPFPEGRIYNNIGGRLY